MTRVTSVDEVRETCKDKTVVSAYSASNKA